MSGLDTLYLPHKHMGLPMCGPDTMYLLITRWEPRCPTQTRYIYRISRWAP